MTFVSATLLLILVMDPLGNLPIFATTLRGVTPERRGRVLRRELLIALGALLGFLAVGERFFSALSLSPESVRLAGGIVLLLIALRMVFPAVETGEAASPSEEPFIVPLAIPLLAGPSTLSAVLLLSGNGGRLVGLGAVVSAWAVVALVMASTFRLERLLGERGMIAIERLMGMLLAMVAVQMLIDGIRASL